jgi:dTDP-4-amino-4,6-dideoxygalactose transaminase
VDEAELKELADTLKSGWLTRGPKSELFETKMANYLGTTSTLAVSSGTAALHLALVVLGVGPGQGVITTPLTFASTAHAIVYQGARPFLVDINPETGNLDPRLVKKFLTEECRTGSDKKPVHQKTNLTITTLMPVHYGGRPVELSAFQELAAEFNLGIVEDAAHALGAEILGRRIGGDQLWSYHATPGLVAFSFYATKNLTTGEGGLLTASDPALLERARILSAYGISDARKIWGRYAPQGSWVYDVAELGYKYNFTDLQAALGLAQLEKLPYFMARRRALAKIWTTALSPLEKLVTLPREIPDTLSAWHLYPLRLKLDRLKANRDQIFQSLKDLNLGTSVMFIPIHYHSYYRDRLGYPEGAFPLAEAFFAQELSLPMAPALDFAKVQAAAQLTGSLLASLAR